ncbi:hypothetical protein MMC29_000952 [Sticta canariensis]|nr:hypothetical protein [Sticta canariensis]
MSNILRSFLQTFLQLFGCLVSVMYLATRAVCSLCIWNKRDAKISASNKRDTLLPWHRYAGKSNHSGRLPSLVVEDDEQDIERRTESGSPPHVPPSNHDHPNWSLGSEILEGIAVIGEVALNSVILSSKEWDRSSSASAGLIQWTYILLLLFVSITSAKREWAFTRTLKVHRALFYFFNWVVSILLLRSIVLRPWLERTLVLRLFDLLLTSLLLCTSIFSSNRPQIVEHLDDGIQDTKPSREPAASFFSLATFTWVDPIIWSGYRNTYEISDVWGLPPTDKSARVLADFQHALLSSRLAMRLLIHHTKPLLLQGMWAMCSAVLTLAPTLLLKLILEYLENPKTSSVNAAWLYVALLFVSGFLKAVTEGQASWLGNKVAVHLQAIAAGEIFAKSLKRKATADPVEKDLKVNSGDGHAKDGSQNAAEIYKQATIGKVTNLMAVDSTNISEVTSNLPLLWASVPAELVIGCILLYSILGYASIGGFAIMVLLLPIKILIARGFSKVQTHIMAATDARIQATSELVQSIRVIKSFAWEDIFFSHIQTKRNLELQRLRRRFLLWTLAVTLYNTTPVLIAFFSFSIYTVVEKRSLKPSAAFPAISLFALLRISLDKLAGALASIQEALVSVHRVEAYLRESETDKYRQHREHGIYSDPDSVGFRDATFTWAAGDPSAFRMTGIDLEFAVDELNIITGPTGSGKTTLLLALMGEMELLRGSINFPGVPGFKSSAPNVHGYTNSLAYCAQRSWLINSTIRDNILFGSPWDGERYSKVVNACALEKDIKTLPSGDQSIVGDKGTKLSGGQKQRVALARAVYSKARFLLLDDCLSAVDTQTAQWIMERCIEGELMRSRTRILVSHNVELTVKHAKFVAALKDGTVIAKGLPGEIELEGISDRWHSMNEINEDRQSSPKNGTQSFGIFAALDDTASNATADVESKSVETENMVAAERILSTPNVKQVLSPESKATGTIKWGLFKLYFKAFGRWYFWLAMCLMFFANQLSTLSIDLWIRNWANSYQENAVTETRRHIDAESTAGMRLRLQAPSAHLVRLNPPNSTLVGVWAATASKVNDQYFLTIYALLALAFAFIKFIRMLLLFAGSLSASQILHTHLLTSITRASFTFYDATPIGQILNRFSRDIETIDQQLAPVLLGFQHAAFSALMIWIVVAVTTPLFILPSFAICGVYLVIGKLYINSSRDLKRIESIQRSPLYQHLDETVAGVVTVRAYGQERRFAAEALRRLDMHSAAYLGLWATNAWLAFRVDVTSSLVSFFAGAFVVAAQGRVSPGAAGLSLTYAITFTEHILWLVKLYAVNEQNMNSVERVKEYIDAPPEAPTSIPETIPLHNWPIKGSVEFSHYSTKYRNDLPYALHDINLKIHPGENLGVVGRTGAGKTSLTAALFRALEAFEGKILIDEVDISKIGLHALRGSVTLVPQDPTVFTGTLRSNLDPFTRHTDGELYDVLRQVHFFSAAPNPSSPSASAEPASFPSSKTPIAHEAISSLPYLLTPIPSSTDSPFSLGQCQLICLARALLRRPKILIMDEATASVDIGTDKMVQRVVMALECTVIIIAHRIDTVRGCDRVVVLEGGKIVQIGAPNNVVGKSLQREGIER